MKRTIKYNDTNTRMKGDKAKLKTSIYLTERDRLWLKARMNVTGMSMNDCILALIREKMPSLTLDK